jgi:hypothetical protein
MLSIPKTPCPVRGLVPWMGGLWPIASRKAHPMLGWLYVIHEKRDNMGLVIWANVSQEEVVREMDKFARFRPGSPVRIGAWNTRKVLTRKWDFERGTMVYTIEGPREGRPWQADQDQLLARIKATEEEHA